MWLSDHLDESRRDEVFFVVDTWSKNTVRFKLEPGLVRGLLRGF